MPKFIELYRVVSMVDVQPILVNADRIAYMHRDVDFSAYEPATGDYVTFHATKIILDNEMSIHVSEFPADIVKLINSQG